MFIRSKLPSPLSGLMLERRGEGEAGGHHNLAHAVDDLQLNARANLSTCRLMG